MLKFPEIKEEGPNFLGEPVLQNVWIIWSPVLYFNFKSFLNPNSLSFLRFQCSLYESGVLFSGFSNFLKIKEGGFNFWGEAILQNVWIIWSPLLYFSFKSFLDPNSVPFICFQCILCDSGVLLSGFSNFCKLRSGDLISGGNKFCRMSSLFGPPPPHPFLHLSL